MRWPRGGISGATLAAAIVALAVGGALAGTATGARVAAEAAPPSEAAPLPGPAGTAAPEASPPQVHSVLGRVMAARGEFLRVRTPDGTIARVHVLPRALIRRAGERVELDAIQRGDRVLAVGRVNPNGVLQARAVRVQPTPLSRPLPPADVGPGAGPPGPPPAAGPQPPGRVPLPKPELRDP